MISLCLFLVPNAYSLKRVNLSQQDFFSFTNDWNCSRQSKGTVQMLLEKATVPSLHIRMATLGSYLQISAVIEPLHTCVGELCRGLAQEKQERAGDESSSLPRHPCGCLYWTVTVWKLFIRCYFGNWYSNEISSFPTFAFQLISDVITLSGHRIMSGSGKWQRGSSRVGAMIAMVARFIFSPPSIYYFIPNSLLQINSK